MTAGATRFPLSRFFPVAAVAGVLWAGLAVLVGILASYLLPDSTLLAMVIGVGLGMTFGLVIDWVVARLAGRNRSAQV